MPNAHREATTEELGRKRSTSFYLTEEAHRMIDDLARRWGVHRNAVIERSVRAVYAARGALEREIRRQASEREADDERR